VPRILLVEDHASFRGALAVLLGRQPGTEVVAQARLRGRLPRPGGPPKLR
jgi:DNA-binding NarL/FixJ family response regulator